MDEPQYQVQYRQAWMEYRDCLSEHRRKELESIMDNAQNNFQWQEFQDFKITLPGFVEFWQGLTGRALGMINAGQINLPADETEWRN